MILKNICNLVLYWHFTVKNLTVKLFLHSGKQMLKICLSVRVRVLAESDCHITLTWLP